MQSQGQGKKKKRAIDNLQKTTLWKCPGSKSPMLSRLWPKNFYSGSKKKRIFFNLLPSNHLFVASRVHSSSLAPLFSWKMRRRTRIPAMQNADLLWESTLASAWFVFVPRWERKKVQQIIRFRREPKDGSFCTKLCVVLWEDLHRGGVVGRGGGFLGITNQSHKAASFQTGGRSEIE